MRDWRSLVWRDYRRGGHVLPELGQVPLADLTPPILQAWVASLAEEPSRGGKPLSSQTITYVRAILHAAMEEAFMP